jgi:hypothetical protein
MVVAGKMTKSQAELFLAYYCINKKAATHIVHHAQNMRALDALGSTDNTSDEYLAMLEQKKKYPLELEEWKYPTFWMRAMRLDSQIDVPMHLVFLGAVQGVIGFIHSWLRKHNKYANFMRLAQERFSGFLQLKLNWLKILLYKGDRLGGWVSENYVGFTRVAKWFYLILDELKPDDPPFEEPDTPQKKWTAKQNKGWLKARGLPLDGYAKELQTRVANCMAGGGAPLLPPPDGTMDNLHHLVDAMHTMVKSIMFFEVNVRTL